MGGRQGAGRVAAAFRERLGLVYDYSRITRADRFPPLVLEAIVVP
jgi:hypothetical protein